MADEAKIKQVPPSLSRESSHHRVSSTRDLTTQRLNAQGSYAKYYKSIVDSPFSVKIRCNCGRSREMAWMFLCTFCATGTPKDIFSKEEEKEEEEKKKEKEKEEKDKEKEEKDKEKKEEEEEKEGQQQQQQQQADVVDKPKQKEEEDDNDNKQRPFLSCDLCAFKSTESYFCPHCLQTYPAHYVKQQTRCPRCVACPICVSPLDKIVYQDSNTPTPNKLSPNVNNNGSVSSSPSSGPTTPSSLSSSPNNGCFLYQCPFCFWSSDIAGLQADVSGKQDLLNNLNTKTQEFMTKAQQDIAKIQEKYEIKNEELRQEQERIYTQTAYHTSYRKSSGTASSLSSRFRKNTGNGSNLRKNKPRKVRDDDNNKMLATTTTTNSSQGTSLLLTPDILLQSPDNGGGGGGDNDDNDDNDNKSPRHKRRGNSHRRHLSYLSNPELVKNEFEKLDRKLQKKQDEWNVLQKLPAYNDIDPLDIQFVTQFSLEKYASLNHKLNNPLTQDAKFQNYLPQRFHLMTKESFKCPNEECNTYVCKPALRGRVSNFDVRTAVLDYFPKISIHFPDIEAKEQILLNKLETSSNINEIMALLNENDEDYDDNEEFNNNNNKISKFISMQNTKILIKLTNRTVQSAKFKFDTTINDNDKIFSTAKVTCSDQFFEIDSGDIHIKDPKGTTHKKETRQNGDWIRGREAGIHFNIMPIYYDNRDIQFSIQVIFETKLTVESDDGQKKKGQFKHTLLPYILDFNLGPATNPKDAAAIHSQLSSNNNHKIQSESLPQNKSRGSGEFQIDDLNILNPKQKQK